MSRGARPRRLPRGLRVGLVLVALVVGGRPVAGATSGGGARSTVTPAGDIVTTVLTGTTTTRTTRRRVPVPSPRRRCTWSAVSDGTLEWLVAVGASVAGRASSAGRLVAELQALGADALLTRTVQAERCAGVATGRFRTVPTTVTTTTALTRTMVTRLPPPQPRQSPPAGVPVLVGEPVFTSFDPPHWQPVRATLRAGRVTAEVEAVPVGFRVVPGDPGGPVVACLGPGTPYDPADLRSPLAQSAAPGRGATVFTAVTGVPGRPTAWIGTVTVLWSARWRVAGGPWRPLGQIPRTRVLERQVRQATTAVETTRRAG
ncbi:MAG: hypothetical protein ACKO04_09095 [Actinomycetes bacterium]